MGTNIGGISVFMMLFIDSLQAQNSEITSSIDQLVILAGLVLIVILVLLSIITGLLWKILQLKSQHERDQDQLRAVENGHCVRETRTDVEGENGIETENLLAVESENHLDLDQNFCIEKPIENLKIMETCKFSSLQSGQIMMSGQIMIPSDVMIRKPLNQNDRVHRLQIKQELKFLFDAKTSGSPLSGYWKDLKNPNILRYLGFIEENGLLSVVSEYPEGGNLLNYIRGFQGSGGFIQSLGDCFGLRAFKNQMTISKFSYKVHKAKLNNKLSSLSTFDLLSFAYQIAKGMRYLASVQLYHRQLCLQNVFLTSNKTIRIGNFSLARTGQRNALNNGVTTWDMPVSHRAPETFDENRYTDRSDVWSFGVCLYELLSLGVTPYEEEALKENGTLDDRTILMFVKNGGRLKMPEYCNLPIYNHMKQCWNSDPFSRPTFTDSIRFFEQHFKIYDLQILDQINDKLKEASDDQQSLEDSMNRMNDGLNGKYKH